MPMRPSLGTTGASAFSGTRMYLGLAWGLLTIPSALLTGRVVSGTALEPLPYAQIEVEPGDHRAVTDRDGYFSVSGLPTGVVTVRVAAVGHRAGVWTVQVGAEAPTFLLAELPAEATPLEGVRVSAPRLSSSSHVGASTIVLDRESVSSVPVLVEADVLRAVDLLPSVSTLSDFSTALYTRGGSPDQTLLTLDGIPLFNPYHLGGLFAAVEPEAIAAVAVTSGGMPASTGDRLAGAIDLITREGRRDRVHQSGSLGLLAARAMFDGPLPWSSGAFVLSARRSHVDLVSAAAERIGLREDEFPYAFTDVYVKLTHDVNPATAFSTTLYANREGFEFPEEWNLGEAGWDWGSRAISGKLRTALAPTVRLDAQLGVASFDGRLESLTPGEAAGPLIETTTRDWFGRVDLRVVGARSEVQAGFHFDTYELTHRVRGGGPQRLDDLLPVFSRSERPSSAAPYVSVEHAWSGSLSTSVGIRALSDFSGTFVWMPRVGLRWEALPGLSLTAGGGRYAQVIHSLRDEEAVAASAFAYDFLAGASGTGALPEARDVTTGVEWRSDAGLLRLDAYTKWFDHLRLLPLPTNPLSAPALRSDEFIHGSATSRGIEALGQYRHGRYHGLLSYTFADTRRNIDGTEFYPRFDRRHTIDATAGLPLAKWAEMGFRLLWMSGQPYTPATVGHGGFGVGPSGTAIPLGLHPVYGQHGSARLPSYTRLDVSVRGATVRTWFGREVSITPFLSVLNVLNRSNVAWSRPVISGGKLELEDTHQIPFLPSLGVEWRF